MEEDLLFNVIAQHSVYLERLKTGEARRFDPALRALDKVVRDTLDGAPDAPTARGLNKMLGHLAKEGGTSNAKYLRELTDSLKQISGYTGEFHAATLRLAGQLGQVRGMLTPEAAAVWRQTLQQPLQATGQLLEPFTRGWSERALQRMERVIRVGYAQGLSTAQIAAQLRGTAAAGYRDGVLGGLSKREADAMVHTSIAHVNSSAQMAAFAANADKLEGYQWLSILDSRTSTQCRSLDGLIFAVGKGPVPPIHVLCRSSTIPVVKGTKKTGLRRASGPRGDHNVRGNVTYYEWLKRQPKYFQIEALGKTRAELFRKGGLSAQEFARLNLDKNFQPLTLEQMRKKNPAAFALAGLE